MGYQTPDPDATSGNLDDYIQTLALLGNLARLSNVAFSGDDGLGDWRPSFRNASSPDFACPT